MESKSAIAVSTTPTDPPTSRASPVLLSYEGDGLTPPTRPWWVWVIVTLYVLIAGGLALLGLASPLYNDPDTVALSALVAVLLLCEVGLLVVPVRIGRRRPVSRRTIWIPIVASGFLAGGLVLGAGFAWAEWARAGDDALWLVALAAVALWGLWALVFGFITIADHLAVALSLHRWLLAGSVVELLVAVPTHVVVRRRSECCAGIMTGTGICIGVAVMLLSFGPGVAFLFHKRWSRVRPSR